ncbi:MAG: phenylalanine--tRNA ligase subunit alpha [Candidatus Diapherotrites archaeon]|uniref:phenylalanine--tRNA ligase n=1 Tax=Candidatus Iainarchaeum sp. TaxID=3101447 RepID=A0A8T3YLT6_9ARCH|nr:phenylalanine--tRNA ligase subunit alpha [Candidatus Diapherotrites archaeon]
MDLRTVASSLSDIEKKTLTALSGQEKTPEEIANEAGMNTDSSRRAVQWLMEKGLAGVSEIKSGKIIFTPLGEKYFRHGLPEEMILASLHGGAGTLEFREIMERNNMSKEEFSAGLGKIKPKNFVAVVTEANDAGGKTAKLSLTEVGKSYDPQDNRERKAMEEIAAKGNAQDREALKELRMRGICSEKEETTRKVSITREGEAVKTLPEFSMQRAYNVLDPVPRMHIGKKQPYVQFLNIIRRKLTELGFVEMEAPLIVHEFYNFDVLFQPQNHPARTWTDTYRLKAPEHGRLADRKSVGAVKAAHETGGVSASSGWKYTWLEEIASKVMPTAHGTAHSGRQLTKGVRVPGKYFAIARCFRPDVLDATHLIEFNQMDGFIIGEDLNFTHLLGMLEQFAREIAGASEVKFIPDYYPFTEPSCQLSAKHPKLGWIELGGAGMFRPEILENLGIKGQAIAWGIGIDRLAMFKLGINDIRHLFSDNLEWLRKTPLVME